MTEKSSEQAILCRADTATNRHVLGAFLHHAGLSYRLIEQFVARSYETVRQWYNRFEHLFEPDNQDLPEVAVDETKVEVYSTETFFWAAVDCETLYVLHVDVTPGRSSLNALLFFQEVMQRWGVIPLMRADRVSSYDWPLELLNCDYKLETWGIDYSSKPGLGCSCTESNDIRTDFLTTVLPTQPDHGSKQSPAATT